MTSTSSERQPPLWHDARLKADAFQAAISIAKILGMSALLAAVVMLLFNGFRHQGQIVINPLAMYFFVLFVFGLPISTSLLITKSWFSIWCLTVAVLWIVAWDLTTNSAEKCAGIEARMAHSNCLENESFIVVPLLFATSAIMLRLAYIAIGWGFQRYRSKSRNT
jgi:hypothetical protein